MALDLQSLRRRMVEIDYRFKHRHLPGSLSALPIIASIYDSMGPDDVFLLSKGHSCAALYAVLEALGKHPNCALVHPERDPENGVVITAGSLGHGLPIAVGMARARLLQGKPGVVHVLMGDGECQEGTTYEALMLANRLELYGVLMVHIDWNRFQGSERVLSFFGGLLSEIFPIRIWPTKKGQGVNMFESQPEKSVHLMTEEDFNNVMEELK